MADTITPEEWQRLSLLSIAQLVETARSQVELAEKALRDASELPWYANLPARSLNAARWQPLSALIAQARRDYEQGVRAATDAGRRISLNGAVSKARWAIDEVQRALQTEGKWSLVSQLRREADWATNKVGPYAPGVAAVVTKVAEVETAAVEYVDEKAEAAKRAAVDAAKAVAETAKKAGSTLQTGTLLLFGGVALGLGAALYSRLGSSSPRRRGSDLF